LCSAGLWRNRQTVLHGRTFWPPPYACIKAEQLGRLQDILNAARLIGSYVGDATQSEFACNTEKQDAVIRRIEVIGEAAVHLSQQTRQAIPELPFRKMRGMRNIVAHDYANVDLGVVWEVATIHVPELCGVPERFFASPEQS
jgi:uncharacterized protein with HEPN domain